MGATSIMFVEKDNEYNNNFEFLKKNPIMVEEEHNFINLQDFSNNSEKNN